MKFTNSELLDPHKRSNSFYTFFPCIQESSTTVTSDIEYDLFVNIDLRYPRFDSAFA